MKRPMELEICCSDVAAVEAARCGGARRIELCTGLSDGGVTPSAALIEAAVNSGIEMVNVLIRPRPGDFLYTPAEIEVMERDVAVAVEAGCTGVVIGALTAEGEVDMAVCSRLIERGRLVAERCGRRAPYVTFHRAFDVAKNASESLERIVALGCNCLLTSGMAPNAWDGRGCLAELVKQSDGRITIMAGAGVKPENVKSLVEATGVGAVHSTARKRVTGGMLFRRESVPMGAPGMEEYEPLVTHKDVVAEFRRLLRLD